MLLLRKNKELGVLLSNLMVLLVITVFIIFGIDVYFCLALCVWSIAFLYAIRNFKKRILLTFFLISFFVFLLSGHFAYEFFGLKLNYYFSYQYYRHSNVLMALTLLFILFAHIVSERIIGVIRSKKEHSYKGWRDYAFSDSIQAIKKASKLVFYVTFPFLAYTEIFQKYSFVSSEGYASYYVDYMPNTPYFVQALANMSPYALFIFLATMPRKSECRIVLPLYLLYATLSLLTGRRIYFVLTVLFIIMYFLLRNKLSVYGEAWITRRTKITILIAIPLILAFLFEYNYLRFGRSSGSGSLIDQALGFLQQQGFSSSVIRLGEYYKNSLNPNAYYSFFGIVKWLRTNSILGIFFDFDYGFSYARNSIEYATYGNSLSNSLSLLALGSKRYLNGFAVGSCYIAELYFDFGYWGIVLGNIVYGVLMTLFNNIYKLSKHTVWKIAFLFIIFDSFVKTPRWNFDIIFSQLVNLAMWSTIVLVIAVSYLIRSLDPCQFKNLGRNLTD